jgi:hypothetical protein
VPVLAPIGHAANDRPRANTAGPDASRRIDRPVATVRTVPLPPPAAVPPAAEAPLAASAPPPKQAKPVAHAAKPAPVERGRK